MDDDLKKIKTEVYDRCDLNISDFIFELEGKKYNACRFMLNGKHVISRSAKITPKKIGQFVTFWKRYNDNPIEPFMDDDQIDFFVVNVSSDFRLGQFVFPKSILIKKGVISTKIKEGKRAFRVYPNWDIPTSKQAYSTQQWQLEYFYEINALLDMKMVSKLYVSR